MFRTLLLVAWALAVPAAVVAHDDPVERDVTFECEVASLAGTLTVPHDHAHEPNPGKVPCVVLIGGTMSHTRDGGMDRPGAPPRTALRRLAHALADHGYASLRFDKPGHRDSRTKAGWKNSYKDESQAAAAAIQFAAAQPDLGPIVAAGESAGAYLACLAARDGTVADAYLFLGGHCGPGEEIYSYNFQRLAKHYEAHPEDRPWIERDLRFELALGRHYREMFAAAARGDEQFTLTDGDLTRTLDLFRRREEIDQPPDEMFRHITAPTLALSGSRDANVPPEHAARIVETLRRAGNHRATCVVIPGADHSFQKTPDDEPTRFRERYDLSSFRRDYDTQLDRAVFAWLDETLPKLAAGGAPPSRAIPEPFGSRAVAAPETHPATASSPARIDLAPGIQIVEDITNPGQTAAVETLEGRIGPLLLAEGSQAHFIDMPGGMYCEEHPHSSESVIYTVKGQWVLCSGGRRHLMKPGTLFHFAANTPTGYEVPYAENAFLLIFKGRRTLEHEEEFINYLKGMAARLEKEHEAGIPYLLKDLPADHPALEFAREVNPGFTP